MSILPLLLLLAFIAIASSSTTLSQPHFLYHFCNNREGNYSKPDTFSSTLTTLLPSLPLHTPISGFYSSSSSSVHASALCRGDIKPEECRSCVEDGVKKLISLCPLQKQAIAWYDECMVRYSGRPMLGVMSTWPKFYMWNANNSTRELDERVEKMMRRMRSRAMGGGGGGSSLKFATEEAKVSGFENVYGLVQCTPDISMEDCGLCLNDAIQSIPDCCSGRRGGRVVGPSCNIRFELYKFFDS